MLHVLMDQLCREEEDAGGAQGDALQSAFISAGARFRAASANAAALGG
jgi:hypothetical protein